MNVQSITIRESLGRISKAGKERRAIHAYAEQPFVGEGGVVFVGGKRAYGYARKTVPSLV